MTGGTLQRILQIPIILFYNTVGTMGGVSTEESSGQSIPHQCQYRLLKLVKQRALVIKKHCIQFE